HRGSGAVRRARHREAPDLRARPRARAPRHADRARHPPRGRRTGLSVFGNRSRYREQRTIQDAGGRTPGGWADYRRGRAMSRNGDLNTMYITQKHLPRRTFLRGAGAALALPLLDAMVPAFANVPRQGPRLGFVYVPHGAVMSQFTPDTVGRSFEFKPILKPLEDYRERLSIVSGLHHRAADSTAVHSLSPTTWLSGVRPKPTQGVDAYAGVTADQIAAQMIGQDTMLPSMELATEDH